MGKEEKSHSSSRWKKGAPGRIFMSENVAAIVARPGGKIVFWELRAEKCESMPFCKEDQLSAGREMGKLVAIVMQQFWPSGFKSGVSIGRDDRSVRHDISFIDCLAWNIFSWERW
jgi:hypothetical protein